MLSILRYEALVVRRAFAHNFGDISSLATILGLLIIASLAFYSNAPNIRDVLDGLPFWQIVISFGMLPLTTLLFGALRISTLRSNSLIAALALSRERGLAYQAVCLLLGIFIAGLFWIALVAPATSSGPKIELWLAVLGWVAMSISVYCLVHIVRLFIRISASQNGLGAIVKPAFPIGGKRGISPLIDAVVSQQSFHSAVGRAGVAIWFIPIALSAALAIFKLLGIGDAEIFEAAILLFLFIGTLVLGRVDYRTVRFLGSAGHNRFATVKAHLIAPLGFALGTSIVASLAGVPIGASAAVALAAVVLAAMAVSVRIATYRRMTRAKAELYIQRWLWLCAISGVIFLPVGLAGFVLWIWRVVKLETGRGAE